MRSLSRRLRDRCLSDDPKNLIRLGPAKGGLTRHASTPFAGVLFLWVSRMKSLKVNGVERQFASDQMPGTLTALLDVLGVGTDAVVAEVDGRIVRRDEFHQTQIRDGQQIELIRLMGGG